MPLIQPYAASHESPSGPGDARPTALKIVQDQNLINKWHGKVVLVTGCSPGSLGARVARALHATGADVYITVSDAEKGLDVARNIMADGNSGKVEVIQLDLTSPDSIRHTAKIFLEKSKSLHLLINNAGALGHPPQVTNEGVEYHFAANYLGHFLLFQLLRKTLLQSAPEFDTRVINVASVAHRLGTYDLDDLAFNNRDCNASSAYAASKLALVHFSNEIERRCGPAGVHAFSVDPGITDTSFTKLTPEIVAMMEKLGVGKLRKTPEQGAATPTWAAVAGELQGKGGQYLEHCSETELCTSNSFLATGYGEDAYNEAKEKALWAKSLDILGLEDES